MIIIRWNCFNWTKVKGLEMHNVFIEFKDIIKKGIAWVGIIWWNCSHWTKGLEMHNEFIEFKGR